MTSPEVLDAGFARVPLGASRAALPGVIPRRTMQCLKLKWGAVQYIAPCRQVGETVGHRKNSADVNVAAQLLALANAIWVSFSDGSLDKSMLPRGVRMSILRELGGG